MWTLVPRCSSFMTKPRCLALVRTRERVKRWGGKMPLPESVLKDEKTTRISWEADLNLTFSRNVFSLVLGMHCNPIGFFISPQGPFPGLLLFVLMPPFPLLTSSSVVSSIITCFYSGSLFPSISLLFWQCLFNANPFHFVSVAVKSTLPMGKLAPRSPLWL